MEAPREYTITVSNTSFVLFNDQIHRDAPNYFTNYFEGSFKEARDGVQVMKLNRDPYLFIFIHTYLCGRLKNLLADARFYGLDSLAEEVEAAIRPIQARRIRGEGFTQPKRGTWKIFKREGDGWSYILSINDRAVYQLYLEGIRRQEYHVTPVFSMVELEDEMEDLWTWCATIGYHYQHFVIGKVKSISV